MEKKDDCTALVIWGDENISTLEQESQEMKSPFDHSQDEAFLSEKMVEKECSPLEEEYERCQIPTDSDIERIREEEEKEEDDSFQEVC